MNWLKSLVIFAVFLSGIDCLPTKQDFVEDSIRLPGHTRPLHYDVDLTFHVHNGTRNYSGKVIIKIICDLPTDVITLHNKGLTISKVLVNGEELTNSITLDKSKDFLFINLERQLTVGNEYSVEIWFEGLISLGQSGLYRTEYTNVESGEIR